MTRFTKIVSSLLLMFLLLNLADFYAVQVRPAKRRRRQHQREAWEVAQKVHHHPVYRDSPTCPQPSPRRLLVPALVRHLVVHGEVPLMLVRRREAQWRLPLSKQLEKPPRIRRKRYMTGFNTRRTMLKWSTNQISKQVPVTSANGGKSHVIKACLVLPSIVIENSERENGSWS